MSDNSGVDLKAPRAFPEGVVASPTLGKLFEALAKAQAEFGIAVFDQKNPHFKNEFASLRSIDDATKKQLSKYGLTVLQVSYTASDGPHLVTTLGHSSGEFLGGDLRLILFKQDMQGLGSSITYAKRYAKAAIIGVVSDSDDDAETAVGRGQHPQQADVKPAPAAEKKKPDSGVYWDGEHAYKLKLPPEKWGDVTIPWQKSKLYGQSLSKIEPPKLIETLDWAEKQFKDRKMSPELAEITTYIQEYCVAHGIIDEHHRVLPI